MSTNEPVTQLLRLSREGDAEANERLMQAVYQRLHKLAAQFMSGERPNHTLSATGLVHEAYIKLMGADAAWEDRAHFFGVAARTMRHVLVDYAKSRKRAKRGGEAERVDLDEIDLSDPRHDETLLELNEALERLAKQDERKASLVELVYFGGLTQEEAAETLGVSTATVTRDLKFANAWLRSAMGTRKSG